MKKAEFDKLVASVKEAGHIRRGQQRPARVTEFAADDVRAATLDLARAVNGAIEGT